MTEAGSATGIIFLAIRILLCLLLSTASLALPGNVVGRVDELKGTAQIERDGHYVNVKSGMPVAAQDILHSSSNGTVSIALSNGNTLILTGSSAVVIDYLLLDKQNGMHCRLDLLAGHVRCIVGKEFLASTSGFEVHAPNAIAVAHGTEFEMTHIEGKSCPDAPRCRRYTDVSVYKGIVEVSNPADPTTRPTPVRQGYETAVPCALPPTPPAPLAMRELGTPGYQ